MSNTTTTTNIYAETIAENRFIASAQLSADDMGAKTWKQYRQLCDNIAIASWNSLIGKKSDSDGQNIVAMSLNGLFAFFGSDAKAVPEIQRQFLLACVNIKKMSSEAMKKARKAKRAAQIALDEAKEEGKEQSIIDALQEALDEKTTAIETLKSEPHNEWYDKKPMLDKSFKHATAQCRKNIEDTMADLMATRAMMTIEEKQAEKQRLDDERKGREIRKKKEAKAKTETTEATTTNA